MHLIGDPHLGRVFKSNVPIDRRGDRERMMMDQFRKELATNDDFIVIVGDLFETPIVHTSVVYDTAMAILDELQRDENKLIVVMAGNHDLDKNDNIKGSFHLLAMILELQPRARVLFKPTIINNVAFFPWEYGRTALEQLNDFTDYELPPVAVGHWDLASFGDDSSHLVPSTTLSERGVKETFSGHWHVRGDYLVDGFLVHCTGSMQPMTHAEDPEGKLYVTLTKEKYEESDPKQWREKYVRVRIALGEEVTPPPTCLGFKTDYITADQSREVEKVNLGDFNLKTILSEAFTKFNINTQMQKEISDVVT